VVVVGGGGCPCQSRIRREKQGIVNVLFIREIAKSMTCCLDKAALLL